MSGVRLGVQLSGRVPQREKRKKWEWAYTCIVRGERRCAPYVKIHPAETVSDRKLTTHWTMTIKKYCY
jgi:hypothetical protein